MSHLDDDEVHDDDSFNDAASDDSFNDDPVHDDGEDSFDQHSSAEDATFHQPNPSPSANSSSSSSSSSKATPAIDLYRKGDYIIQNEDELCVSMDVLTKDVAGVLHVPQHLASMLLRTHNWSKEKFESAYFEDCDGLLAKYGLQYLAEDGRESNKKSARTKDETDIDQAKLPQQTIINDRSVTAPPKASSSTGTTPSASSSLSVSVSSSNSTNSTSSSSTSPTDGSNTHTCPICYDEYPTDQTVALGCGHRFCDGCWSGYLVSQVNDGKLCIVSRCPAFKCPVLVPDKVFKNLTPPDIYAKHQTYLVRSYVEDSRMMRWCPAQRCTFAVRAFNSSLLAVKCRCGYSFCFRCGEENHAPVDCEKLGLWLQKCKNESETAHWIIANCFPAADHQILTSKGFLYLQDVQEHFRHESSLSVACPENDFLVYKTITAEDVTVHTGHHRHIRMQTTSKQEQANQVSICPTDNHRMYARVGQAELHSSKPKWFSSTPPMEIHTAEQIFAAGQKQHNAVVQFSATCVNGSAGNQPLLHSRLSALGVTSESQINAFFQLYGLWVKLGSHAPHDSSLKFPMESLAQQQYLDSLLRLLSVEGCVSGPSIISIRDRHWHEFFNEQQSSQCSQRLWRWILTDCNKQQALAIFNGVDCSNTGCMVVHSVGVRDDLLQLAFHAGLTASFTHQEQDQWEVRVSNSEEDTTPALHIGTNCAEYEEYGTVWCVSVPTDEQLIVVRQVLQTTKEENSLVVSATSRPIIVGNTRKCPKCSIRIEKNQGCNHMTCRSCKFEWCWVCNGDWQSHGNHTGGYYKCNKWDPKEVKTGEKGSAEEAKAELNRYLHYYQRYHNHDQSKRFTEKLKIQTEKRMATLHAQSGGDAAWIDFQFLMSATQTILECRNVLKYTYVFAYYLEPGPEKTLFEFLQQQLEAANEHLSELSELKELEKIDRAQVVNYSRITAQFCQNLLQGVANGLTPH